MSACLLASTTLPYRDLAEPPVPLSVSPIAASTPMHYCLALLVILSLLLLSRPTSSKPLPYYHLLPVYQLAPPLLLLTASASIYSNEPPLYYYFLLVRSFVLVRPFLLQTSASEHRFYQ